jgi:hypothetical protein
MSRRRLGDGTTSTVGKGVRADARAGTSTPAASVAAPSHRFVRTHPSRRAMPRSIATTASGTVVRRTSHLVVGQSGAAGAK